MESGCFSMAGAETELMSTARPCLICAVIPAVLRWNPCAMLYHSSCPPQALKSDTVHYLSPNIGHWEALCLCLCRDEWIQLSWILSLVMTCMCIIPLVFFPFCLSSLGELPVATTGYFALSFLAIQVSVFRFKPGGIFLLFCWLGKKKLILVSVFLAIWRPKKTLKNHSVMKKQGIY